MTATAMTMVSMIMARAIVIMILIASTTWFTVTRGAQHPLVIGLKRIFYLI